MCLSRIRGLEPLYTLYATRTLVLPVLGRKQEPLFSSKLSEPLKKGMERKGGGIRIIESFNIHIHFKYQIYVINPTRITYITDIDGIDKGFEVREEQEGWRGR